MTFQWRRRPSPCNSQCSSGYPLVRSRRQGMQQLLQHQMGTSLPCGIHSLGHNRWLRSLSSCLSKDCSLQSSTSLISIEHQWYNVGQWSNIKTPKDIYLITYRAKFFIDRSLEWIRIILIDRCWVDWIIFFLKFSGGIIWLSWSLCCCFAGNFAILRRHS